MKKLILTGIAMLMFAVPAMASDSITVYSNGNEVADKGVIIEGRTMVPVRGVFEYMGYDVSWDSNTKTATLTNTKKNSTITLTNGESTFKVNDKVVTPDVPQQIVNGRFMLPLRAVGEAVGEEVKWDGESKTAYIGNEESNVDNNQKGEKNSAEAKVPQLVENPDGTYTIPGISIKMLDPNEAENAEGFNDVVAE